MSTFLVTLATGQQGQAIIKALTASGAKVHAVVRDPTNDTGRELERQGVVLFKGNNDDFDVFRKAAKGCTGLFLNLVNWPYNPEPGKQAEGILKACREVGVEHVVASTAGWAGAKDKWANQKNWLVSFCASEALVEEAVRQANFKTYTILRPFWFHSNYLPPVINEFYPELLETGELVHSFAPGSVFPHINVADIGRFAAMALLSPAKFNGREIELASQNLTVDSVIESLQKVTQKKFTLKSRPATEEQGDNPVVAWQYWASTVDLSIDTKSLEEEYDFSFTTLDEYLYEHKTQLLSLFSD